MAAHGGGKYQQLSRGRLIENENYLSVRLQDEQGREVVDGSPLYHFDPRGGEAQGKAAHLLLTDSSLKPWIAGMRLGMPAAGSPGMQYSRCGQQLRQLLTTICGTGPDRAMALLCPDAGDIKQPQILSQMLQTQQQIEAWGWPVAWAWWDQVSKPDETTSEDKTARDIDEIDPGQFQYVSTEELLNKADQAVREMATRSASIGAPPGFRPKKPNDVVETPFEASTPEIYAEGDFDHVFKQKLAQGFRVIVNRSFTGAGKSALTARMKPERYGVTYIRWLTNRHLPQAEEFGVPALRGKNYGIKRKANGELAVLPYKAEVDPHAGEKLVKATNCHRLGELEAFTAARMDLATASICTDCSYRQACEATKGGYRFERYEALKAPVVAVHPSAFMEMFVTKSSRDGVRAGETGVVVDEFNVGNFVDSNEASARTVRLLLEVLKRHGRSPRMQALLEYLVPMLAREGEAFMDHQLRRESAGWAGPLAQMSKSEWLMLQEWEEGRVSANELSVCLVAHLRDWVLGKAVMCIDSTVLQVLRRNERLLRGLRACKWVLVHDATVALREVAALIAEEGEEIAVIAQDVPADGADVDAVQFTGAGMLGFRRTEDDSFRIGLVLKNLAAAGHLPVEGTALIDTKAGLAAGSEEFAEHAMAWLVDNRGSNRAASAHTLLAIGAPVANLRAQANRYTLLFGRSPDLRRRVSAIYAVQQLDGEREMVCVATGSADPDFRRYVHHTTQAELLQARGRLREYRRGGEMLRLISIGDYPMPWPVSLTDLAEMSGWSRARSCLTQAWVVHTVKKMAGDKQSLSRQAIADELGVKLETFERWLKTRSEESKEELRGAAGSPAPDKRPSSRRAHSTALVSESAKPVAA
jgi:hypothetical protein